MNETQNMLVLLYSKAPFNKCYNKTDNILSNYNGGMCCSYHKVKQIFLFLQKEKVPCYKKSQVHLLKKKITTVIHKNFS